MGRTLLGHQPFQHERGSGEHNYSPAKKTQTTAPSCELYWTLMYGTLNGFVYLSSGLKCDEHYCCYNLCYLEFSPFKADCMTDRQRPWCLVCFLWEAQENHFPSSLLPIPSPAIKGSRVVSPDVLQRKNHVQRTVSLSCAALHYTPFIIINIRSCWNSPCEWKISLFSF